MDFAALMAKELAAATKSSTPAGADQPSSSAKYVKKSELEARRVAAYRAEQNALEAVRAAKAEAKRKRAAEEAEEESRARDEKRRRLAEETRRRLEREAAEERERRKRIGLPEVPPPKADNANDDDNDDDNDDRHRQRVTDEDAVRQLRELGEPALLFGESAAARLKRLRRLSRKVTAGPIPTTLEPVDEAAMKVPSAVPKDKAGRAFLYRQLASYFTMVLAEYQRAMDAEKRDTATGRTAYNAMEQCRENMKPLFRKFEKDGLENDVLGAIVEIVKAAQERRYVDANDGYLRLSIGKAAWPIGVTMVGIHERSAREKLHGGERGHVMGDEVTRKFMQSIKRCLTFAQTRWPPEDIRQLMG